MPTLTEKIIEVALRFVGQTESGSNNSAFADPKFQRDMQKVGWQSGWSWCACFCELVFKTALLEEKRDKLWNNIEDLFSPGAVDTLNRFAKKGYTVRQIPKPGDLVVWRLGPGPSGHIGIVVAVGTPGSKMFTTVEGNTAKNGTDIVRDSDSVAIKQRRYGLAISSKKNAFNLLGFIAPVG